MGSDRKWYTAIGVTKDDVLEELGEAEDTEEFINSLSDTEMNFIADVIGQKLYDEEVWTEGLAEGIEAIKDIRSGRLKLE